MLSEILLSRYVFSHNRIFLILINMAAIFFNPFILLDNSLFCFFILQFGHKDEKVCQQGTRSNNGNQTNMISKFKLISLFLFHLFPRWDHLHSILKQILIQAADDFLLKRRRKKQKIMNRKLTGNFNTELWKKILDTMGYKPVTYTGITSVQLSVKNFSVAGTFLDTFVAVISNFSNSLQGKLAVSDPPYFFLAVNAIKNRPWPKATTAVPL